MCTVDADRADIIARLGGRTWRGPTLETVSNANWEGATKDLQRAVRLAVRAHGVLERARRQGYDESLVPFQLEDLELLKKLELPPRTQRRLGRMLAFIEQWLERPRLKKLVRRLRWRPGAASASASCECLIQRGMGTDFRSVVPCGAVVDGLLPSDRGIA